MKASWEKKENNQAVLTVEVDAEKVTVALDRAFKKVVQKVNVPGFRKGKLPRPIFESRFGVESLYQDALDILLPEAYNEAIKETGIEPVDRPEVDVTQMEKGQNLIFTATVTIKPEVILGDYKGLEIEKKEFAVTDEDIQKELVVRQERIASIEVVEDEGATLQEGDHSTIDFEGFVDGVAFDGGKAEDYSLIIGSGSFIPGFEDQMVGMKKGEEREINVNFPEEYHAEELAGKPAVFKVKLNEFKRKNLPAIDDEFAKDVSEFETLEELKQDIRSKLEEKAKQDEENYIRDAIVEKVAENATIDLPQIMIDNEVHQMMHEFDERLQMQGINLQTYFQYFGQDEETLKEQFKADAEKRVRVNLTLEAIAKVENVEVEEGEVNQEIERLAEMYKREPEEIKALFEAQGVLANIKEDLRFRKTVDFLVEQNQIA